MSSLRDTIKTILWDYLDDPVSRQALEKKTDQILQAVRDVVPEEYLLPEEVFEKYSKAPYIEGYNACRADMLKELGGEK